MSWEKINRWLERFKKFPIFRLLYRLPGAPALYHFLLAFFGSVIYGFPSQKIFVIGVTGTKGKTTTLELINAVLEAANKKTALLSSLRVKVGDKSEKNKFGNTLPGRFFIQNFLKEAVRAKCQYALVEVTSQGAVLSRHLFINWNAGILTNLAPEHIESHGSFEKYREAKLNFLRYVAEGGGKIFINQDDKNADFFLQALNNFRPSLYSKNDEEISRLFPRPHPLRAATDSAPPFLLGDFNKDNIAAAVAIAKDLGIEEKQIEDAVRHFKGVPGRMEFIQWKPFAAVIDYAHTPDSLTAVYKALTSSLLNREPHPRLICVLGAAGGGRDKWKRPAMGKVAAEYCDEIILTNEDPYDEKPEEIMLEIKSGIVGDKTQTVKEIVDRREAIQRALGLARDGDVVIATGKGSEDFIHISGGKKIPWSERVVVEELLLEQRRVK